MKKLTSSFLIVLLILAGGNAAKGQVVPMLQPQQEWMISHWYWGFPGWFGSTDIIKTGATALFDGKLYTAVQSSYNDGSNWIVRGWLREDSSGRVYHYMSDSASERLLYDFTLSAGDTFWYHPDLYQGVYPFVVEKTDTITLLNGEKRKRITLEGYNYFHSSEWIEGIGSTHGLLYDLCIQFVTDIWCGLNCVYHNSTLIYTVSGDNACILADIEEELPTSPRPLLLPNPWHDELSLEFSNARRESHWLDLYDMQGRRVRRFGPLYDSPVALQASELPAGVYTFCFSNQRGEKVWGKILKW